MLASTMHRAVVGTICDNDWTRLQHEPLVTEHVQQYLTRAHDGAVSLFIGQLPIELQLSFY